jgi:hypothetical protein
MQYNHYDSSARALNAIRRCAIQHCKKDKGLMKMNKFAALAVMALLAACGGGGGMVPVTSNPSGPSGTPTPTAPSKNSLTERFGDAILVQQNLVKLGPTSVSNMPTSGSSTFSGSAFLSVSQGGQTYEMIGDSKLAVNFGNSEMTGGVTNVEGRRSNGSTFAAPGKIAYDNGLFEKQNRNIFTVDYAGNLAVDNKKIAVDGTAIGAFYGNRPNAAIKPSGFLAVDETADNANTTPLTNMTATVDGKSANGSIFITGRN